MAVRLTHGTMDLKATVRRADTSPQTVELLPRKGTRARARVPKTTMTTTNIGTGLAMGVRAHWRSCGALGSRSWSCTSHQAHTLQWCVGVTNMRPRVAATQTPRARACARADAAADMASRDCALMESHNQPHAVLSASPRRVARLTPGAHEAARRHVHSTARGRKRPPRVAEQPTTAHQPVAHALQGGLSANQSQLFPCIPLLQSERRVHFLVPCAHEAVHERFCLLQAVPRGECRVEQGNDAIGSVSASEALRSAHNLCDTVSAYAAVRQHVAGKWAPVARVEMLSRHPNAFWPVNYLAHPSKAGARGVASACRARVSGDGGRAALQRLVPIGRDKHPLPWTLHCHAHIRACSQQLSHELALLGERERNLLLAGIGQRVQLRGVEAGIQVELGLRAGADAVRELPSSLPPSPPHATGGFGRIWRRCDVGESDSIVGATKVHSLQPRAHRFHPSHEYGSA